MKKIDLGETMQLVANLSVIAGLFFLAFQVRQNTAAVQAQTLQGLEEASASYLENLGRDTETWSIVGRLAEHPEIGEVERSRLTALVRAQFVRYQTAYLQWQKGSLSDEGWRTYLPVMCGPHRGADGWDRAQELVWPNVRGGLVEGFRDFAEKCRPDFVPIIEQKSEPIAGR